MQAEKLREVPIDTPHSKRQGIPGSAIAACNQVLQSLPERIGSGRRVPPY